MWNLLIETMRTLQRRDAEMHESFKRESELASALRDAADVVVGLESEIENLEVKIRDQPHASCDWVECYEDRYGGWRFCKEHLSSARKDMKADEYLQTRPWQGNRRTSEMMEDTRETKYGKVE